MAANAQMPELATRTSCAMVTEVRTFCSLPDSWTKWFAARFHVLYHQDKIGTGTPSCRVRRAQRVTSLSCHVQCVTIGPAKLNRISPRTG